MRCGTVDHALNARIRKASRHGRHKCRHDALSGRQEIGGAKRVLECRFKICHKRQQQAGIQFSEGDLDGMV